MPQLAIFSTNLGWFGLLGDNRTVVGLLIGHISADDVRKAVHKRHQAKRESSADSQRFPENDWWPELRRRFEAFAQGTADDFADIELDWPPLTEFQRTVLQETRRIPYGQTVSYGELAARAGSPRAARAVGSIMAGNRFPLIIPCHRVLASGGRIGGFSAPHGVTLKQRLLELEQSLQRMRLRN